MKTLRIIAVGLLVYIVCLGSVGLAGVHVHHDTDGCHGTPIQSSAPHSEPDDHCCYRESTWQHTFEDSTHSKDPGPSLLGSLTNSQYFFTPTPQHAQLCFEHAELPSQALVSHLHLPAPPCCA